MEKSSKVRLYLDNCSYNRPFDDQTQMKIRLETSAKLYIQNEIRNGVYELAWSFMNDMENNDNPYDDRRGSIQKWESLAKYNCKASAEILKMGKSIEQLKIKPKDSLNIACAIVSNCDYFITTDTKLLNKIVKEIKIINPMDFIVEMEENDAD
jgi:predicted nucleic acid-binding protein